MNDVKSLSHSKRRCKYHIVFAPNIGGRESMDESNQRKNIAAAMREKRSRGDLRIGIEMIEETSVF